MTRISTGRVRSEHDEQASLIAWSHAVCSRMPEIELLFAIPNGGQRHIATGRRLKEEGVKAGVPDIFLPVARQEYHGLFIELKTLDGQTSKEQDRWIDALSRQGYLCIVCYGWWAAARRISDYLGVSFEDVGLR